MSETDEKQGGIYDTSGGRCDSHLTLVGEDFRCMLSDEHDGWAHQSQAAEAIWQ